MGRAGVGQCRACRVVVDSPQRWRVLFGLFREPLPEPFLKYYFGVRAKALLVKL
jgi:hypothetical protein